jgi:phosphoribosylanthranilate isomerase
MTGLSDDERPAQAWAAAARPRVKVCGLTRADDAALAARLGAWAVGFVLAESPRRVTAEQAADLAAAARAAAPTGIDGAEGGPRMVGVFVDASPETIAAAVDQAGLDAVQLHGPQPGAEAVRAALGGRASEVIIIQAVPVPDSGADLGGLCAAVATTRRGADLLLFDTQSAGRFGGTGTRFRWELAREAAAGTPFLVAGGIGPLNVRQALAASGAVGVDVSSGLESSPGVKHHDMLRALFATLEGTRP